MGQRENYQTEAGARSLRTGSIESYTGGRWAGLFLPPSVLASVLDEEGGVVGQGLESKMLGKK